MVMREVDSDGSGFMDYTEFLKASIDQKKLLSQKNLERAFSLFDRDGSGTISTAEIRKVLASGSEVDESIWAHILNEVDENGDGEIDVKEFEALLQARF
jgi:calcium-dependent protein kinase